MATTSSKLENLTKEDLVKFIKKQSSQLKQLKSKCEDFQTVIQEKDTSISILEEEKTTWLSHRVQAEFEKKKEITAKNEELQMAAELSKKMLQRNDELQEELDRLKMHDSCLVEHERDFISAEESVQLLNKIKELQSEREETLEKLDHLTTERNHLMKTCKELKLRMHALENDVDRLNKGKRNLADCQDASDDKTELISKINMLEEDKIEIVKEFENVQEIMLKLENEKKEDKLKFDLLTKEKLAADENIQDLEEKVNSLHKEVEDLKERLDNYSNDQEDVHSSYEETRRDLLETRDKHEILKQQIEGLLQEKLKLVDSLSLLTEEKSLLEESNLSLVTKNDEIKLQLEEMNQRNKELSVQLQSVNQENSQIRNKNKELLEILESNEKHKNECKQALEIMTIDNKNQGELIETLQQEKKKMTQLIKKLRNSAAENVKHAATDEKDLKSLLAERDDLRESLKSSLSENEAIRERFKSLEKQHENVLFEKDEMQEELADLNETRTLLQDELKTLKEEKLLLQKRMNEELQNALHDEKKKTDDILDSMKDELKANLHSNELLNTQLSQITVDKEDLERRFIELNENHKILIEKKEEWEKQLQFTLAEKTKTQNAMGAVKSQWEEHQVTCGGTNKDLEERIQKLVAEKLITEKALDDRVQELNLLQDEKKSFHEKINIVVKEKEDIVKKMQQQIDSLESEYEEYKNDMVNSIQTLDAKLSRVNDEKNNLDADFEELLHAHEELQIKHDDHVNANKELNNLLLRMSVEKDELFNENQVLSARLSSHESNQLDSPEPGEPEEISRLQMTNENLLEEIACLKDKLNEKKEAIAMEENPVFSDDENEVTLSRNETTENEKVNTAETRVSELTQEKYHLQNSLNDVREEVSVLSMKLEDKIKENLDLQNKLKEFACLTDVETANDNEVVDLRNDVDILKNENSVLKETIEKLEGVSENYSCEIKNWKEKYFEKECEKDLHVSNISTFVKSLKDDGIICDDEDDISEVFLKIQKHMKESQQSISFLNENAREKEQKLSDITAELNGLSDDLQQKETLLLEKEEVCRKNEQDMLNVKTAFESVSVKLTEKSKECENLMKMLENEKNFAKELEENLKNIEKLAEERQEKLILAEKSLSDEVDGSSDLQSRVDEILNECKAKDKEISILENDLLNSRHLVEELENDIKRNDETYSNKLKTSSTNIIEKTEECESLKEELQKKIVEVVSLQQSLESRDMELNEKLSSSNNQVVDLSKEIDLQTKKFSELSELLKQTKESEKYLKESLSKLTQECLDKETELNKLRETQVMLQTELSSLKENNPTTHENLIKKEVMAVSQSTPYEEESRDELKEKLNLYLEQKMKLEEEINRLRINESNSNHNEMSKKYGVLEKQNKELQTKMNKMKQLIVKAKKESESLKQKCEDEKAGFSEIIKQKDEKIASMENENELKILRDSEQSEIVSKLEEELQTVRESLTEKTLLHHQEKESFQERYENIEKENLELKHKYDEMKMLCGDQVVKIGLLEKEIEEKEKKCVEFSDQLKSLNDELTEEKSVLNDVQSELTAAKGLLEHSEKEAGKASLVDLELADCQNALEKVEKELSENEIKLRQKEDECQALKDQLVTKDNNIASLEGKVIQAEEKEKKLKDMLKNSKKKSSFLKEQENTMQQTLKNLEKELEKKNLENENIKVQLSVVHAEKLTFEQQLHSVIENNAVHLESLDAKLNRLKGECEAAKRAKSELESEYENYKTRVHSVLKQQKSKPSTPSLNVEDSERSRLQQNILQLKIKHQETSERLHSLQSDYEDLETENEKLTTAHAQLSLDSENKERFWKERIEKISQEYSTSFERQKETIEHLNMKNETLSKSFKEKIRKLEEDYKSKIEKLNREIDQIEKEQKKESPQLKLNLPADVVNVTFEERQAGEGMDNTELEQVNVFSQPTTPASTASLHSVALETLLSPNKEIADLHDTVLTEEEILTARREIEHLSELLRESEATAMRLGEQAKVLKNEIRRLERNQEREEGLSNLEYLKNIIIKFLSQGSNEKEQLIPVLTTMLKLSEDEKDFLSKYARDSDGDDEPNSSWSSYLYRWSSVN